MTHDTTPSPCPECGSTAASHFCTGKPYDSAPYPEYTYTEVAADIIPLTPEEVERKIKEIERRYRITSYSPWKDDVLTLLDIASALQSQLKTRTEDAERMAEELDGIACRTNDSGLHDEISDVLSSLHHSYPPKP